MADSCTTSVTSCVWYVCVVQCKQFSLQFQHNGTCVVWHCKEFLHSHAHFHAIACVHSVFFLPPHPLPLLAPYVTALHSLTAWCIRVRTVTAGRLTATVAHPLLNASLRSKPHSPPFCFGPNPQYLLFSELTLLLITVAVRVCAVSPLCFTLVSSSCT